VKLKSLSQRYADLGNNLGFSLYAALSVCHIVAISDKRSFSSITPISLSRGFSVETLIEV